MRVSRGVRRRALRCLTRPVTPEVAGSSPVAPAENILQIGIFRCRSGAIDRRFLRNSRTDPAGLEKCLFAGTFAASSRNARLPSRTTLTRTAPNGRKWAQAVPVNSRLARAAQVRSRPRVLLLRRGRGDRTKARGAVARHLCDGGLRRSSSRGRRPRPGGAPRGGPRLRSADPPDSTRRRDPVHLSVPLLCAPQWAG
jgi:hypothetical protein